MHCRLLLLLICLSTTVVGFAQSEENLSDSEKTSDTLVVTDKNYREDQFYASITYNLLGKKPDGVSQSGFSSGFHFGFIRDMPINERRNIGFGIGLGLSTNSYNQTLLISENDNTLSYEVIAADATYSKNKFTTYLFEIPIEFRWRTSTITEYDFWRIYTGVKFGYVLYNTSKFNGSPQDIRLSNIDDFNKLQYGLTISIGYSKVNAYCYYALNSIFDDNAKLNPDGAAINLNTIKIGLIFYVL